MTNVFAKVSARIFFLFILINVETSFALDLKRDVEKKHLDEILSWNSDLNVIKTYIHLILQLHPECISSLKHVF